MDDLSFGEPVLVKGLCGAGIGDDEGRKLSEDFDIFDDVCLASTVVPLTCSRALSLEREGEEEGRGGMSFPVGFLLLRLLLSILMRKEIGSGGCSDTIRLIISSNNWFIL